MSAKAKAAAKIKRLSFKRARKESQQKQYQTWAAAGQNQRSKRSKIAAKKKGGLVATKHSMLVCQNHGCSRCHPDTATPKMNNSYDPRVRFRTSTDLGLPARDRSAPWKTSKEKLGFQSKQRMMKR